MRELILGASFEEVFGASNAPDVSLFKYLRQIWPSIDQTNYQCGFESEIISTETADDVANFAEMMLSIKQVRCDYKELLELTIIRNSSPLFIRVGVYSQNFTWVT